MKDQKNTVLNRNMMWAIIAVIIIAIVAVAIFIPKSFRDNAYKPFPSERLSEIDANPQENSVEVFQEQLKTYLSALDDPETPEEQIPDYHIAASTMYEVFGQLAEAKQHVEQAIALRPNDSPITVTYSRLLFRMQDYEGALEASDQALGYSRTNPVAWEWRAELEEQLLKDPTNPRVSRIYFDGLEQTNYESSLTYRYVDYLERIEFYDDALNILEVFLEKTPDEAELINGRIKRIQNKQQ